MNENHFNKDTRYCQKELIHIIKSISDKEQSKADSVITYENGALFKYADLYSKIVKLYLVLPIERFGKDGIFFQNNAEYKPLTLSVISPKFMRRSSFSNKSGNNGNVFSKKLEKSISSKTIFNTRINISTKGRNVKKDKYVKYKKRNNLSLKIFQKEKNLPFIKGNKTKLNKSMSPPIKSNHNINSNSNIINKNGHFFKGSNLKKHGSSLNVSRLFLQKEDKRSLLQTFILNNY